MEQSNIIKPHRISVDNRKRTALSGIKDIIAFDMNQVMLESNMGMLEIKGNDLKVTRLDLDKGEVDIAGHVDGVIYSELKAYSAMKKNILKRSRK